MRSDLLVGVISASVRLELVDSRALPRVAELLLEHGLESPGIVQLAVLGTEPFDPRDAREFAGTMLSQLSARETPVPEAADFAGAMVARALRDRRVGERAVTHQASQLAAAADYAVTPSLMALCRLDDAWDSRWAGSNERIAEQVQSTSRRLLKTRPEVGQAPISESEWRIVEELLALHP